MKKEESFLTEDATTSSTNLFDMIEEVEENTINTPL